jgi:hypothetical protein
MLCISTDHCPGYLNKDGVCSSVAMQLVGESNLTCAANTTGLLGFNSVKTTPSFCNGQAFVPIYETPYGGASNNPGTDCLDILKQRPAATSDVYWIKVGTGAAFQVYCDMVTDGGGWFVVLCTH